MGGIKKKSKVKSLHLVLFVCVFALLGLYLFEVNSIVKERFALEDTKNKIQQLRGKNEELKVRASQAKSLYSLEALSSEFDLEEVKHITYIEVKSTPQLVLGN